MLDNIYTYLRLDKGKPPERMGRKAVGLKLIRISLDCQAAEILIY